jgi:hypothetical protein
MSRVSDLTPGDLVFIMDQSAVFIARTQHPLYRGLQLVIWRMTDGIWSHDALDERQDVGQIEPSTAADREQRLRKALIGAR